MKIIQAHNFYQIGGGEDTVVNAERVELEAQGHTIVPYYKHNSVIQSFGKLKKARLVNKTTWSQIAYDEVAELITKEQPDVVHVHNFLPLISPSIFQACADNRVPVVQTLHNYRLICTNGLLLRNGKVCEDCLGNSAYNAVAKKCYRNSAIQTYAVARMLEKNKQKGTWRNLIDAYICLTDFARSKFMEHGIPSEKLMVKGNFVHKPSVTVLKNEKPYLIFVGRITASKGIHVLKEIAGQLPIPLKIVGEGDAFSELDNLDNIECLGKLSRENTLTQIANAEALILPSIWYEGMPMTILEAFALKTPVIASRIGAMVSLIQHQKNGLLFSVGNAKELLEQIKYLRHKNKVNEIITAAYLDFEQLYAPKENIATLVSIYNKVIQAEK